MTRENELTSILRPFQSHGTNRMSHEQSSRLADQPHATVLQLTSYETPDTWLRELDRKTPDNTTFAFCTSECN